MLRAGGYLTRDMRAAEDLRHLVGKALATKRQASQAERRELPEPKAPIDREG